MRKKVNAWTFLNPQKNIFLITIKPEYNDHLQDPKIVVVVDRWSLFGGKFVLKKFIREPQVSGRYRQVVVSSGLTVLEYKYPLLRYS